MITTHDTTAYRDDFNSSGAENKNYLRILFNGGRAVQIRELNQLQSILQSQIDKFGSSVYKEGVAVIGGGCSFDPSIYAVTFEVTGDLNPATVAVADVLSQGVGTSAIIADIIDYTLYSIGLVDYVTFYIRYSSSGGNSFGSDGRFLLSEIVNIENRDQSKTLPVIPSESDTKVYAGMFLEEGVFFTHGSFIITPKQTKFIDVTDLENGLTGDVVLTVAENIITFNDDATLVDNASGSYNYLAPGADRYQIVLTLDFDYLDNLADSSDSSLSKIVLLTVEDNNIIFNTKKRYSDLDRQLAQRTHEESGNYITNPFKIDIKELEGSQRTDSTDLDASERLYVGLDPSVAYVEGYRVELNKRLDMSLYKARTIAEKNVDVTALFGNYIDVTFDATSDIPVTKNVTETYDLRSGTTGALGSVLGTCRIKAIERLPAVGLNYRLFLYDVELNGNNFTDVTVIHSATLDILASVSVFQDVHLDTSVFPLPHSAVESIGPSFSYIGQTITEGNTLGGAITISASPGVFADISASNFIVSSNGAIDNDFSVSGDSTSVTISGLTTAAPVKVLSAVRYTGLPIGAKGLTIQPASTVAPLDSDPLTNKGIYRLPHADIYKILSIMINDIDVTSDFTLFDGQSSTKYTNGTLTYKTNKNAVGTVIVSYSYFTHSNLPFTRNSYNIAQVAQDEIPTFRNISLGDCIDFRPTILAGDTTSEARQLDPYSVITCDPSYYLPRIDKVIVTTDGEFAIIEGIPDLNPTPPATPSRSMVLYELSIPAYTNSPSDVIINMIDNRRYTMRDIGKLDKRLSNVEYYTSLSLLETSLNEKSIFDGDVAKFKNGMIIDSFYGHGIGNVYNSSYNCSIDENTGTVRPKISTDAVDMFLTTPTNSTVDISKRAKVNTNTVTLPFTETTLISQLKYSETISVNPYDVASFVGNIQLSPSNDRWMETNRRPDVIVNINGASDNFSTKAAISETGIVDSTWGVWDTKWVGTSAEKVLSAPGSQTNTSAILSTANTKVTVKNAGTVTQSLGDKIVDINFIPFIRSRRIYFTAKGMKPLTKVYAFFDNINVSAYAKPETGGTFITTANTTAVATFFNQTPGGTITTGDLITDENGQLLGSFVVPNNSVLKFRTGDRVFRLTDSTTNSLHEATTYADTVYNASGMVNTVSNTIISVKPQIITVISSPVVKPVVVKPPKPAVPVFPAPPPAPQAVRWVDPLAQTILIDTSPEGAFVTSLELWFTSVSKTSIPVQIHIVSVDNGYPTQNVIPFSQVVKNAENVINATNPVTLGVSTVFEFSDPVYLKGNTEYAFVILSNDPEYRVQVARLGGIDIPSTKVIQSNPYGGVMFTSQNASTWTADQTRDIRFKLNRAIFAVGSEKEVEFKSILTTGISEIPISAFTLMQGSVNLKESYLYNVLRHVDTDPTVYSDIEPGNLYRPTSEITVTPTNRLILTSKLNTASEYITPVIDLDGLSIIGVHNKINTVLTNETTQDGGSALSRYISREIELNDPADQLNIYLDINRPIENSNVSVYIKLKHDSITYSAWTLINPITAVPISANTDQYNEVSYVVDSSADDFIAFSVKLVFTSSDTVNVPSARALRIIATS